MYLIHVISIVAFVIPTVLIIVGATIDNEDVGMTGFFGLLLVFLLAASFKAGAHWQNDDINVKYTLTPKEGAK